ncbi:ABC transporter permease [Aquibaculum arenosum]|uniref:ABC transporter permease n=1 Tax=Aquibaculum arenosum TaxID=3032591 RepID=A0ABT5YHI8_9PROT|nr:ABC transporter permease [Fodinicurvata sp. CAU 1616]MDF2094399.1 ABC transporter permease [Fodinicurvata sp. CAU 1616]
MRVSGHRLSIAALVGLAIIFVNVAAAVLAPWIAPYSPTSTVGSVWLPPGEEGFLLGTDQNGRDMLTRMLYGARTSIGIALTATILSFLLGSVLGFLAATVGGWLDQLLSRIVDTLMAIPVLILALLVLTALGSSIPVLIGVIAVLDSTRVFRLSRAVGMDIAVMEYVEAARLRGEGLWWIIRREILPNALPPLIAEFGLRFCFAFLLISSLSFLGLGVQPPFADWGGMVRDNAQALEFGLSAPLIPAAGIAVLTIGVNLVVDWMLGLQGRTMEDSR